MTTGEKACRGLLDPVIILDDVTSAYFTLCERVKLNGFLNVYRVEPCIVLNIYRKGKGINKPVFTKKMKFHYA